MNRIVLAVTLAGLMVSAPSSAVESARQILDEVKRTNDARKPHDMTRTVKMTISDSRGSQRYRQIKIYTKGDAASGSKSIFVFLTPADVKGVAFLSWSQPGQDSAQWLFLPAVGRVRRINSTSRRESFQGSDFTYEDLDVIEKIRDWTEREAPSRLIAESEIEDGASCAVIELTTEGMDLDYRRVVAWVHRDDATIRRLDLYDRRDDSLSKQARAGEFRTVDNIPSPSRLEMTSIKRGSKTVLELVELSYNRGLGDEMFTERYLERGHVE